MPERHADLFEVGFDQVGQDVRVDLMLAEQGFVLSEVDRVQPLGDDGDLMGDGVNILRLGNRPAGAPPEPPVQHAVLPFLLEPPRPPPKRALAHPNQFGRLQSAQPLAASQRLKNVAKLQHPLRPCRRSVRRALEIR